jgi:hypothetical protein
MNTPAQPYAGLERRAIKALSPERMTELLTGGGAGYALAAELNHYPGPKHVLQLAPELELRPDQETSIRALVEPMEMEAKALGERLITLEAELDAAYAAGRVTATDVERLTAEIAAVDGGLRRVHLVPHLQTRALLTPEQVARYDHLRGYADKVPSAPAAPHRTQPAGEHHKP